MSNQKKNIQYKSQPTQVKKPLATAKTPVAKNLIEPKKPILQVLLPYLWITGVCFAVYGQTFGFEFTGLDDSFFLVVYSGYFADFKNFWRGFRESGVLDYYRPILFGSMIFDFQFTKTDPFFYHITNVIYHWGACLVIYRMLEKLKYDKTFALLTTIIFTAHPLLTQAVAWVPGRNDSMITLMLVGSFNYFLNYYERRSIGSLILHWFWFIVALYTKETSSLFPFVCIAFVLIHTPLNMEKYKELFKPAMIVGVGWGIIGLIWLAIRKHALDLANKNGTRFTSIIFGDSWIYNLPTYPEQIGKMLVPINQSNFAKFTDLSTFMGIGVIVLFIIITILVNRKDLRMVAFSQVWFMIFFVPTITFVFADSGRYDYLEHRIYMPFVAIIILVNEWLRGFFNAESRKPLHKFFVWGLIALCVTYSVTTLFYSQHFKNPLNFWLRAVEGAPTSSQVYRGLGKVYYDAGDLPNAETAFMNAVRLNRSEVNTISDLGKAYENKKELDNAERCYRKAIEVDSNNILFLTDLARIYEKRGLPAEAEKYYIKCVQRDPNMWQAKFGLGVIAYQKGDYASCEQYWLDVVKVNPNYNDTYLNLAVLYYYTQRFDKAIQYVDLLKARGTDVEKLNPGLVNSLKQYRKQ
ncbi:MAG: tetratricopeptide repeat protein [Bacteroidota bacterium]|nr:tetratricopeptide repeat protein [Bacteroidota bacterium]